MPQVAAAVPRGIAGYLHAPSRAQIGRQAMFGWIGDHLVAIVLLVALLYAARSGFAWFSDRGSLPNAGALATGFCNKCGWKGRVANGRQACGRCGSLKITLRTG